MTNENYEMLVMPEKVNDNTLDIMPEIKLISGNKAGNKVFNRFLERDKKSNFRDCKELVRDFKLEMPKGLNEQQEFVLQNLYLKHKAIGYELMALKRRKVDVAQAQKKVLNFTKLLKLDFRK
jgi:hypothetical protein